MIISIRRFCEPCSWVVSGCMFIAMVLCLGIGTPRLAEGQQQFVPDAWPKDTGAAVNSSPVLGDLDGDGTLEIVVGSDNNKVYAWKPDGSLMPGWPVKTGDSVRSSPALADIDGDGRLEVIVGSFDNKVYIWNFNGSLLAGWPAVTGSVVYSSPAVGDIDGDQRPEIVVGSFDNKVYAWNADGTPVRGWPKPTGLFVYSSPALADLDNDGLAEVIVGTDNNRVFAWNGDGTEVEGWPTATEHVVPSSPAVGDLDNDGALEVVVGSWDKVFVWNSRGERKSGWPVTTGHQIPSSPALADLNNDGRLDVIIGCKDGKLYAWDASGQALPGWPTVTDAEIAASPAVADLDGNGKLEVVVGSKDSKVYVWDAEGRLLPGWPKNSGGPISSSPAIGDLDRDGTLEVVIGSKDQQVYAWTFARTGAFDPVVVWQNFHGDPSHSGAAGLQPAAQPPVTVARTDGTPQPVQIQPIPQPQQSPTATEPIVPRELKDGVITDLVISDYDRTSVTLTWTAPPGIRTADTVYEIRYDPEPITAETWRQATPYTAAVHRPAAVGAREVATLTNLPASADTLYIAVRMVKGQQQFPISNVVRVERIDITPPAAIQGLTVTELNESLLELSWQTTGDDGREGTATTYDIRYAEVPLNELTWLRANQLDAEPAPLPAGTEQHIQIPKPWNDREIFFGIKAIDEALNISDLSNVAVWSPRDEIPPSRIVDLRITERTGSAVTLAWTAPGNNRNVGQARQYEIRYADFPITEATWASATLVPNPPAPESSGTLQTFTLQNIPIDAAEFIGMKAIDNSGNASELSNVVEISSSDQTPPAAVSDLKLEQVGKDWVQVSWTAPGDDGQQGTASAYVLRYGGNLRVVKTWTTAINVPEVPVPSPAGTRETARITGLSDNTTYYIGLRVLDEQGNSSELSNILRVKTLGHSAPEAVTDLVIEEIRPDGVTLNWTAPQDHGEDTPTVSSYDIRYAPTEITEDSWASAAKLPAPVTPSPPGTLEVVTVTGVPRDTDYYLALKSVDAVGNMSSLSNVVHVPQMDTVPPDPILDLFVEETGTDWAKLSWTSPGDDQQTGRPASYLIRMASTLDVLKNWDAATAVPNSLQPQPAGAKEEFTIPGLPSEATRYVAVKAVDDFGNTSGLSNIVRVKTKDAVPPAAITDLRVSDMQEEDLVLEWTAPGDDGMTGRANAYDLRYAQEPITQANWDAAQVVPVVPQPAEAGTRETTIVSGLQPNTLYDFAIVATDQSGNTSPLSNVLEVLTSDTLPPPTITTLRAEDVEPGAVVLTWLSPGDDQYRDTPERYDIRYLQGRDAVLDERSWAQATAVSNPPIPSGKGEVERFRLTGLQEKTYYTIGVKALDEYDNAAPVSNVVRIYTLDDAVTDLAILDFAGQNVTLTWTTPGGVVQADKTYAIRYATSPITDETWADATPAQMLTSQEVAVKEPGQTEKVEITSLPPYEQLFFAVRVVRPPDQIVAERQVSELSNVVELNRIDILPPGEATNLEVTELGVEADGSVSLQLTWNAPGDNAMEGTASRYEIRYGTTPPTEANWDSLTPVANVPEPLEAGTRQQTTFQVTPGEENLYFAIKTFDEAFNAGGLSNVAEWSPPDDVPPAPVTDLTVERLQNGDVVLSWTAPGDNGDRGVAAFYDIRYAAKERAMEQWDQANVVTGEPLPEPAGTRQEFTVTGLDKTAAYYMAMKTTDDTKNTSQLSNIVKIEEVPVERINDLVFVGGTETTVTLSWTAPRPRVETERITRYEIRYSEDRERLEEWRRAKKVRHALVPREPGATESLLIEDLEPNSRYYVAVRAVDHTGAMADLSNIVAAYTADTIAPAPIADLTVETMTEDSITLSWTVIEDDASHGMPAEYELRYSQQPFTEVAWDAANSAIPEDPTQLRPTTPGSQMAYTVSGLEENVTYHFAIRAIDAAGNISPLSNVAIAKTRDVTPPQPVVDLQAIFPTPDSVMLSWTSPADAPVEAKTGEQDLTIGAYDIRYTTTPPNPEGYLDEQTWEQAETVVVPPEPSAPGGREEFVVANLEAATTYYFAIKAIDASNNVAAISNTAVEATLPPEITQPQEAATPAEAEWTLVQGTKVSEIRSTESGGFRIAPTTEARSPGQDAFATATYPQGNRSLAVRQGELTFQVKSTQRFALYVKVRTESDEEYYLGYSTDFGFPELTDEAEAAEETSPVSQVRKRIENYIFFALDPAMLDDTWHEVHLNLAQDLLAGAGQAYDRTRRLAIRSNDAAFRNMKLHGPVETKIADFETPRHPLETGWKIHFGSGRIQVVKASNAPDAEAESRVAKIEVRPGLQAQSDNAYLTAQSDDPQGLVLTYPKDATSRLSDKPFFLANVKTTDPDFKVILKVRTQDNGEYYLAYLPADQLQQIGASGNYIYRPLHIDADPTGRVTADWLLVQANIAEDLRRNQLEYAYTTWISFHGKAFSLDNVRFSTAVLETALE
jgi:WD40 repeat protein